MEFLLLSRRHSSLQNFPQRQWAKRNAQCTFSQASGQLNCWDLFFLLLFAMNVVMGYQGFNKVLSRWQQLWSRKKLTPVSRAVQVHALPENFWNLDLLEYISSILEQKLEFLNRTQTSLNFGFFIQRQHMNNIANSFKPLAVSLSVLQNVNHIICKNWSNFQRKVAGKFWWNSLQMSLAAGSYWKLWVNCP